MYVTLVVPHSVFLEMNQGKNGKVWSDQSDIKLEQEVLVKCKEIDEESGPFKVIGRLPYNGQVIFWLEPMYKC